MNESVLNMLSDRLAGGGQVLCAWVTMNEPVAEALAREVFDAVVLDMHRGACRQTDYRSRADRRICPGEPAHGLRGLRNPCAKVRQRQGCATLGRLRQIPAARAAVLGSARRATAQRPRHSRHDQGVRANNRAENSHQPTRRRERTAMAA
jgi:hypothetical protein